MEIETAENEDDFSWEDDDELNATNDTPATTDSATPAPEGAPLKAAETEVAASRKSTETIAAKETIHSNSSSLVATPANTSPRESSEDSYDLVSSGCVSAAGGEGGSQTEGHTGDAEGSGDSDWE